MLHLLKGMNSDAVSGVMFPCHLSQLHL